MNPNATRTLWISLGSALFAMFLIYSYTQEKKADYDRKFGATKKVVVAAKDIIEISTITDDMIQVEEFPANYVQPSAVENAEEIIGMVAATNFKKGEQIMSNKLLNPGVKTGLSLQVAPDRRAVAIPIDDVRGVSKLLRPGDRIDLLAAIESGRSMEKKIEVKTLTQNVVVLSTGLRVTNGIPRVQEVGAGGSSFYRNLSEDYAFSTVTVELTPKQAQDLVYILASSPGSLFVTLRNPNDQASQILSTSNTDSVLGRSSAVAPAMFRRPAAVVPQPAPQPKKPVRKRSGPFVEVN